MSRSITLAISATLSLLALAPPPPARATHDAGSYTRLRALLGAPARYAIFHKVNINFSSSECDTFFAVDLSAKTWNERRWRDPKGTPATGETTDSPERDDVDFDDPKAAKAAVERCLEGFGPDVSHLEVHPIDPNAITGFYDAPNELDEVEVDEEGHPIVIDPRPESLRHLEASWKLLSKGKTKVYTENCSDERGDDGELLPVAERCAVYLRGQTAVWRLALEDRRTGTTHIGTTLAVEPTDLTQVIMGLELGDEPEYVGVPELTLSSLGAYETEDHIFFFGSATHEPYLNGTYLPVAAFVPKRASGRGAAGTAYASPRGCACDGGGAPFDLGLVLPVALALVTRSKRRATARRSDIEGPGLRA